MRARTSDREDQGIRDGIKKVMGKLIKPNEVSIQEIGSFFDTDSEGYLVNPASKENIKDEWRPVLIDIIEAYKSQYGDSLHSVYVRGSVAKGNAVLEVSDVDTFAYVKLKKDEIKTDWNDLVEKKICEKYPFVQGVELNVDPVETAQNDRIWILQSTCVYGEDLGSGMPRVKVGPETLSHVYWLPENIAEFDETISKTQESEEIKKSCTWIMKRFLRTGLELTMSQAKLYTRDLYPSYKLFSEYYPDKEPEMREALYLALNPTDDIDVLKRVRMSLGGWLEKEAKTYKK